MKELLDLNKITFLNWRSYLIEANNVGQILLYVVNQGKKNETKSLTTQKNYTKDYMQTPN